MRVLIPDEILDPYQKYADAAHVPVETLVVKQLKRFARLHPSQQALVIPTAIQPDLEVALGALPLTDAADLLTRIRRHGQITFESLDIGLTPTQKLELQHRAERQGKSVEALVGEMAAAFVADFFHSAGGGVAMRKVG